MDIYILSRRDLVDGWVCLMGAFSSEDDAKAVAWRHFAKEFTSKENLADTLTEIYGSPFVVNDLPPDWEVRYHIRTVTVGVEL